MADKDILQIQGKVQVCDLLVNIQFQFSGLALNKFSEFVPDEGQQVEAHQVAHLHRVVRRVRTKSVIFHNFFLRSFFCVQDLQSLKNIVFMIHLFQYHEISKEAVDKL